MPPVAERGRSQTDVQRIVERSVCPFTIVSFLNLSNSLKSQSSVIIEDCGDVSWHLIIVRFSLIAYNHPKYLQPSVILNITRETKSLQTKITELEGLAERLRKSTKAARDAEKNALAEASRFREDLEKKSAILMRVREERAGSRASRGRRELGEEEREELRSQVAVLQEKLRVMNTAEKPYEDEKESKIVKNAEEVARWDERKKWQKKMEEAKQRLKEADLEVSKLSKQNTSLRETVQRQEREKMLQEAKWKGHLKVGGLKTKVEDGKQELLQMENNQLREEVRLLQEEANKVEKREEPGNETLKLRVKFLQGRVEQQEKKISMLELGKKAGTTGLYKEIENLRKKEAGQEKERAKVDEQLVELKVKTANMDHNMAVLAEVLERLDGLAEMMVNKCGDLTLVENLQKAVGEVKEVVASTGGGEVRKVAGGMLTENW